MGLNWLLWASTLPFIRPSKSCGRPKWTQWWGSVIGSRNFPAHGTTGSVTRCQSLFTAVLHWQLLLDRCLCTGSDVGRHNNRVKCVIALAWKPHKWNCLFPLHVWFLEWKWMILVVAFPWLEKDVSLAVTITCAALAYAQAERRWGVLRFRFFWGEGRTSRGNQFVT